jgi:hypothetical protein
VCVGCHQTEGKGKKNLWREQKSRPRKAQLTPREEVEVPPTAREDDDKTSVASVRCPGHHRPYLVCLRLLSLCLRVCVCLSPMSTHASLQ